MERESLLTVLMIVLGGMALQFICAGLAARPYAKAGKATGPSGTPADPPARPTGQPGTPMGQPERSVGRRSSGGERVAWFRLLRPLIPALLVGACLCGWALSEPDPVPDRVGPLVFIVGAPFTLIGLRALLRAVWSLWRKPRQLGIATIGLLRPRIVVAPELVRRLDDRALRAALAHERAHVRHRDPLRIWIAQFVTDLQWPWSSAQTRLRAWLAALEHERDDEARAQGVDGEDLAAALLATLRFRHESAGAICAPLIDSPLALQERIARLLQPLAAPADPRLTTLQVIALLILALTAAAALGDLYGERLMVGPLLAVT